MRLHRRHAESYFYNGDHGYVDFVGGLAFFGLGVFFGKGEGRGTALPCREGIILPCRFCSAMGQRRLQSWRQFGVLKYKKAIKPLDRVQRRDTRGLKGLEGKPCEDWLRVLGLFIWRTLRANLTAVTIPS